jgi:predicted kinase
MKMDVIILRGAPGSGKSTTAKLLARRIGVGARLEVDTLRSMVVDVEWTNQAQHMGALLLAATLTVGFLDLGHKPVVVVDTFSGTKLTVFLERLRTLRSDVSVRAFALVPNVDVLRARVEGRPDGEFKDFSVCRRINEDMVKYREREETVIDNSDISPMSTMSVIWNAVSCPSELS